MIRTTARLLAVGAAGFVAGAVLTFTLQGSSGTTLEPGTRSRSQPSTPHVVPQPPRTFLAWTPGGLPAGFRRRLASLPGIERSVVVASDNTWLTRSVDAKGEPVDAPRRASPSHSRWRE